MRYVLAIAALVLSAVLLVLGIGQRTFLAGPSEIVYPVDEVDGSSYAVIPGEVFAEVEGQPNVVVSGENAFAAVGQARDVAAWVQPFDHQTIDLNPAAQSLITIPIAGKPAEALPGDESSPEEAPADEGEDAEIAQLDPRGSDLWLEERSTNPVEDDSEDPAEAPTGDQTLRMPVNSNGSTSVLIAADGTDPAPPSISVSWVQDRDTPWAGPLLAAGGLFALIGGILYLLAVDHDRRGLGPRRGRKGPLQGIRNMFDRNSRRGGKDSATGGKVHRTRGRTGPIVIALAGLVALSGCSPSYWPDFSDEVIEEVPDDEQQQSAPVPVTEGQLDNILSGIAAVAEEADDSLDVEVLEDRFRGAALEQRSANYTIRAEVPDYDVLPPQITDESLDYELVQSTEGWPRTIFATVASQPEGDAATDGAEGDSEQSEDVSDEEESSSPSLALVMKQDSPHDNYLVSNVITLRGGIAMPAAAPATEGTAVLADDLQSLVLEPGRVGEEYARILAEGATEEDGDLFDLEGDALVERSGRAWVAQAQEAADAEDQTVQYSVSAEQSDHPIVSLSTGVGGGLVTTTVIEERTESAGEGNWKPTAVGSVTALSGLEGRQERLIRQVAHQMLFYVPGKDSGEQIQILGATSELVGARN